METLNLSRKGSPFQVYTIAVRMAYEKQKTKPISHQTELPAFKMRRAFRTRLTNRQVWARTLGQIKKTLRPHQPQHIRIRGVHNNDLNTNGYVSIHMIFLVLLNIEHSTAVHRSSQTPKWSFLVLFLLSNNLLSIRSHAYSRMFPPYPVDSLLEFLFPPY